MKQFYLLIILLTFFTPRTLQAQNCVSFSATFTSYESRCAGTGAIKVTATGGSGSYKYRVSGPVNLNFTTVDSITGLSAGLYNIEVIDIVHGCQFFGSVTVNGSYSDPRYTLITTDVSCDNGSNGQIQVQGLTFGRAPFTYSIVAPSASKIGETNSTGVFTGLSAGNYTIRLTDSCGGIQTRTTLVGNYTWVIESHTIKKTSCSEASGQLRVRDSRGNYSHTTGITGMMYGAVRFAGDTVWSSNPNLSFNASGVSNTVAVAKDQCGIIKTIPLKMTLLPSIGADIAIDQKTCSTFRASAQAQVDMLSPDFQLFDANDVLLYSNTTGIFPALPYGTYKIIATEACTGISFTRNFSVSAPVVTVSNNVEISNKSCSTFTAKITGQTNVTAPTYRLRDLGGTVLGTNTTGQFANIAYGKYCIEMTDGCVDTTVTRCIDVRQPVPNISNLNAAYITCTVFGIQVNGDSIYSANYCLYDKLGTLIECNNTGKFDSIPLGEYCVTIQDLCYDTTIQRCIIVNKPTLINDMYVVLTRACSTFTVSVKSNNIKNGTFTLYRSDDVQIGSNSVGIFSNLPYGEYYVHGTAVCPDSTVRLDFSAQAVKPAGALKMTISNTRCGIVDITASGVTSLSSPTYTLKNNLGQVIEANSTGKFYSQPYGTYCVELKNGCYDTTFNVCNTFSQTVPTATVSVSKSCYYGNSKFSISSSVYPVIASVYSPTNVLLVSRVFYSAGSIDSLAQLPAGQTYSVKCEWSCGTPVTKIITPVSSYLNHTATMQAICPGSIWPNGSGNIVANVATNAGTLTVRIIKKDMASTSIAPTSVSGSLFNFLNLGPGTYVLQYSVNDGCNKPGFDTVTIPPYSFPDLNRTSAFQCDLNGFSVGAYVNNGVGPFTYEIMSSTPSTPSITTLPQSSPVFNINNGTEYQLIRLRALDACGNATLGDASIMPLAGNKIKGVTDNCLGTYVKLSIDTMINSVVTWSYKKNPADAPTYLGTGFSHQISPFSTADIGYYYCEVVMNDGCVTRNYEFHLDGACHGVLPVLWVDLKGRTLEDRNLLEWTIDNGNDLKGMFVERHDGKEFKEIGSVNLRQTEAPGRYKFIDENPGAENQYRIKLLFEGGKTVYTKVVQLNMPLQAGVSVYPNPATDYVVVDFNAPANNSWRVELISVTGQKTLRSETISGTRYTLRRTANMPSGMYVLKVTNETTGQTSNYKLMLK